MITRKPPRQAKKQRHRERPEAKPPVQTDAQPEQPKVWPEKVIGLKYLRLLDRELKQLKKASAHGNQSLFLDDVFAAYLLAYFNPTVRSLRTIEDFSQAPSVQKYLNVEKISKSTLSDFNKSVDPERLVPILQTLRSQLSQKQKGSPRVDKDLSELLKQTIAVDGTFLPAVAKVAWAVANSNSHGATRYRARLDAHLNVSTWLPETIVVPKPGQSESDSAIENILSGRIYVYDRGYTGFALLKAHYDEELEVKSHFVVRYKVAGANSPTLNDATDLPLDEEDRAAGIISDRVGYFNSGNARRAGVSKILLREIIVPYEENGKKKTLRIITNLLDVPAHVIATLYKYRWQVELFFRWFKSIGKFGHLISHSSEGVLTHLYVTIIAVLLMHLHTGHRPSKYMFALLTQVAMGTATVDEILPILRERERRAELDRASAARRRAKKKAVST